MRQEDEKVAPIKSAYRDKIFLTGMFCIFLVGICFFQMFSIIPVFYKNQLHFSKALTGFILALNWNDHRCHGNGAGLQTGKAWTQRNLYGDGSEPDRHILPDAEWSIWFTNCAFRMVVVTFGEMLLFPFMNHFWVNRSTERNRGQYAAVYTMSFSLAIVTAPTFAAQIEKLWGFNTLWTVNFFVCTIAALGFLFLKKRMKT